jgi:hypothetical protein
MRMTTWKKCTGTQGETILVNVDIVAAMRWMEAHKHTELYFGEKSLLVKETPHFILNEAPTI